MDEIELRIAALELWAIEVGADIDPAALERAAARLRSTVDGALDADERAVRLGTIKLIEDAQLRFKTFTRRTISLSGVVEGPDMEVKG